MQSRIHCYQQSSSTPTYKLTKLSLTGTERRNHAVVRGIFTPRPTRRRTHPVQRNDNRRHCTETDRHGEGWTERAVNKLPSR